MHASNHQVVIERLAIADKLVQFPSMIIGTPPLGLATQNSDIDVAFQADDLHRFQQEAALAFGEQANYSHHSGCKRGEPYACIQFHAFDWEVELFCQSIPLDQQWGVRHFLVEQRLLQLHPPLRLAVLELKQRGMKTEPAFASVLGLAGDPNEAILSLDSLSNNELRELVDEL